MQLGIWSICFKNGSSWTSTFIENFGGSNIILNLNQQISFQDLRAKLKFFDNNMLETLAGSVKQNQIISGGIERGILFILISQIIKNI